MKYVPALDGLRAVAILLVIAIHCRVPGFQAGYVGVDLFFVLSGYLITRILVAEHQAAGEISLRRFYWHRALRLYPALLLYLSAYLLFASSRWPSYPHARDALVAAVYMTDYAHPFLHWGKYLSHTWSLGVEEKFYLLWPAMLIYCLRRFNLRQLSTGVLVAAGIALAWCVVNVIGHIPAYERFDTRLPGLLAGCWLGIVVIDAPAWLRAIPMRPVAIAGVALLAYAMLTGERSGPSVMFFTLPLAQLAAVGIIYGATTLPLSHPTLVQIGRLSYGMYLWHVPLLPFLHGQPWPLVLPITFLWAITASWISYNTIERAARSWRWWSEHRGVDVVPGQHGQVTGVAGVLRPLD